MPQVFSTDRIAYLVGLDKWRVIKFATGKEYEIQPAYGQASGQGTRRLYSLDNAYEIALAVRLLETGFRSKVIGKILRQLRQSGLVGKQLRGARKYLAVFRTPMTGAPLKKKRLQSVELVASMDEATKVAKGRPEDDMIVVPVGPLVSEIEERLATLESGER